MRYQPTDEDQEALDLLAKRDDLTEWEESFIESLNEQESWTERQRLTFEDLWAKKTRSH